MAIGSGFFQAFPCRHRGPTVATVAGANCQTRGQQVELRACEMSETGLCSAVEYQAGQEDAICKVCRRRKDPDDVGDQA